MEKQKNQCVAGSENWVSLLSGGDLECSLNATVVNGQILYFVEDGGNCSNDFTQYEAALRSYIEVSFKKSNNGFATATTEMQIGIEQLECHDAEALMTVFHDEMISDDVSDEKKGSQLLYYYKAADDQGKKMIDNILMVLTGWSLKTLCEKANENANDEADELDCDWCEEDHRIAERKCEGCGFTVCHRCFSSSNLCPNCDSALLQNISPAQ
jgi:hypothetical protein